MMLAETRELHTLCLSLLEQDHDLRIASAHGLTLWADGRAVHEVVQRWPAYLGYVIERDGQTAFFVPPHGSAEFIRTMARAVMN